MSNITTPKVITLDQIETRPIPWMMYPYIAYGKITMIIGDPGVGKSTLTIAIASEMSNGNNIDGTTLDRPINVMYQNAEDNYNDTVKPRFEIANATLNRIHFVDRKNYTLKLDDPSLEEIIVTHNINLLILDPIQAFLPKIDMHRANDVRDVLSALEIIAERTNCAVIITGHRNKSAQTNDLYSGLGSIDFPGTVRVYLGLERDKHNSSGRILKIIKTNISPENYACDFKLDSNGIKFESFSNYNAFNPTKQQQVIDLLIQCLMHNDLPSKEVYAKIKQTTEVSERTIKTAIASCPHIHSRKVGNQWYLHYDQSYDKEVN